MLSVLLKPISKALGGFIAGAVSGPLAAGLALSQAAAPEAELTLLGYIVVGALNGAIGFATVYFAPANR